MTIRSLPEIRALDLPKSIGWDMRPDALGEWSAGVRAADGDTDTTISVYDVIGEDYWSGGGVTAKRVAAALRTMGSKDVTVNVNSPGGDFFEGVAIYNLLREYKGSVTVKVLGLAASAASVIAMAGDTIEIGAASFLMIHNAWAVAVGNRNDMRAAADTLEPFDAAMASVYAARAGIDVAEATKMMDAETWMGGQKAVDLGFADALLASDKIKDDPKAAADAQSVMALRRVDSLLARQNVSRSERRELIAGIKRGTHDAAPPATHDAGATNAFLASIAAATRALNS